MSWDGVERRKKRRPVIVERRGHKQVMRAHFEWVAIAFIAAAIIPAGIAVVEPSIDPVITHLRIEEITETPNGVQIAGSATRLRSCDFVALHWHIGRRNEQSAALNVRFEDRPQVRPTGKTHWDGILIDDITAEELVNYSHATVEYSCRSWGPNTFQPFYDGDGRDGALIYEMQNDDHLNYHNEDRGNLSPTGTDN